METNFEKRSIALSIILSFITCGLYGLYWYYKLTNDAHQAVGRQTTASGGMAILFSIITCGIYTLYWAYKIGDSIAEAREARGMRSDHNAPIIYLLLSLFGLAVIVWALMQSSLNDIVDLDMQAQNAAAVHPVMNKELPAGTADDSANEPEQKD
jgi:hypothetical protein